MIKESKVEIKGHRTNIQHFKKLGYDIQYKKGIQVKVEDLMSGSTVIITCICDNCQSEKNTEFRFYYEYTHGLKSNYYCNKCNSIKRKETCLELWGVDNPMKLKEIKTKLRDSITDKYGVDSFSKTEKFKEKYKQTCIDNWGVDNIFKSEIIKEKIKQTNMIKFGVEYPQQNVDIKQKSRDSILSKFGAESYSQTEECKEKVKQTSLQKWGVDNFSKTDEFKTKIKETSLNNWGVTSFSKTEDFKSSIKRSRENLTKLKYDNIIGINFEILEYTNSNFKILHKDCGREFEINRDLLYQRHNLGVCLCTNCFEVNLGYSNIELEMQDFLNSQGVTYVIKDRTILNGKELDIYLPDYNLAIEMNGLYWHSEIYLDRNYHRDKTLQCREKEIQLLHIWEDDWKYKRQIVKSIILNRLKRIKNKIYARKCQIVNVKTSEASKFLDENHIQGKCGSGVRIGLRYENELVSLMTFGSRFTNGKKEFELIRFCNKINYSIVGGSSKLLSKFLDDFHGELVSYADISIFSGHLYEKLGFDKVSLSQPNYYWVVDGIRRHRFNFNKKRLIKLGYDAKKSESDIMQSLGHYRIFSCGQEKWILKK